MLIEQPPPGTLSLWQRERETSELHIGSLTILLEVFLTFPFTFHWPKKLTNCSLLLEYREHDSLIALMESEKYV